MCYQQYVGFYVITLNTTLILPKIHQCWLRTSVILLRSLVSMSIIIMSIYMFYLYFYSYMNMFNITGYQLYHVILLQLFGNLTLFWHWKWKFYNLYRTRWWWRCVEDYTAKYFCEFIMLICNEMSCIDHGN